MSKPNQRQAIPTVPSTLELLRAATFATATEELDHDPVPAALLEIAKLRQGKPFTKRDIAAIEARFPRLRIIRRRDSWIDTVDLEWWVDVDVDRQTGKVEGRGATEADRAGSVALYRQGVPRYENRRSVKISTAHSNLWESPQYIRDNNRWAYEAKDEAKDAANAERRATLDALATGKVTGALVQAADALDAIERSIALIDALPLPSEARRAIVAKLAAALDGSSTDSITWDVRSALRHR